jgi:hypothetical protein
LNANAALARPVSRPRNEVVKTTRIFIRDDDVGALTPQLTGFVATFSSREIPVSYQVIPASLTAECAAFLQAAKNHAPNLLEVGQHGLKHEMVVRGRRVFYEYGPERSYEEQLSTILEGQSILREKLGADFDSSIFTPPRHRYNRTTLKALAAAGVQILSASNYCGLPYRVAYAFGRCLGLSNLGRPGVSYHGRTRPDSGLFELSITIAVDNGSRTRITAAEVLAQIATARRHTSVVGLMFHHNAYASEADQAFLAELAAGLRSLKGVSFHGLADLRRRMVQRQHA